MKSDFQHLSAKPNLKNLLQPIRAGDSISKKSYENTILSLHLHFSPNLSFWLRQFDATEDRRTNGHAPLARSRERW